jgi:hypothetical protein
MIERNSSIEVSSLKREREIKKSYSNKNLQELGIIMNSTGLSLSYRRNNPRDILGGDSTRTQEF